ncbi:AAA family ATPase [Peribacillus frigoritolerans]|uniref:AAA family ATPase n=1 Tax=Peribacillus frigoritolerans TaxID=450367 RepID=UPI0024C18A3B|nr:AAA family ATPase [Peribacillus frigoritolerans]WHX66060.1 AAA family ATPase [Peribacillus frigoritolerans]
MKEYNLYPVLESIKNDENIPEHLFEQMLNSYELNIEDFENKKEYPIDFSNLMVDKLFKKENKNFHTILSKESFVNLTNNDDDVPFLVYQPLNDHSRPYLGVGDILFSYRSGQFSDLDTALNTRGIYGLGIAMSNPMKFSNQYQGRDEYKDYGVIVFYPFKLQRHLSVRDIQLNPNTINLPPYNGNRNDSLQYIPNEKHYNKLLGMILYKNPHIRDFLEFMNIHIEESIIPDVLWNKYEKKENIENVNFDYKSAFKDWLKEQPEPEIKLKTQSNYISAINTLESTWNKHYDRKIDIWNNPYFVKNHISKDALFNDTYIKQLNDTQNRTHSSAINYYFEFLEYLQENQIKGINRIYFGAPGTGKSYNIEKFIKENGIANYNDKIDCPNVFRATLHPEFTYTDFVGQVMPVVTPINEDGSNTRIEYRFNPQVFTKALKFAIKHSNEPVFLILEEMSRSNVAAVFGDLFQLLDRDENGESEYRIDNLIISTEIFGGNSTKKIYLPNNFFIIGTVNTSDQNVFVMDTAFKRRFEFEYVDANDVAKDEKQAPLNNFTFHFSGDDDTVDVVFDWINLYRALNDFITNQEEQGLGLSEDKQLGQFFIKFRQNDDSYNYNQFSGKLLEYLWNDVQKVSYSNVSIFKQEISNFSTAYKAVRKGKNIFSHQFLEYLNESKDHNGR